MYAIRSYYAYSLYVKPNADATYTVASVTDNIGNTATGSGSVTVVVHQLTPVEITNTRNTYVSSEDRVITSYSIHYTKLYEGTASFPPT